MSEGGHDGAWYCSQTETKSICPQQGCPKGRCEREHGWLPGMPEPDHYASTPPATQADDMETLGEAFERVWDANTDTLYEFDTQADDAELVQGVRNHWPQMSDKMSREVALRITAERAATHAAGRAEERAEETGWLIEHADEPKWLTLRPGEACFEVCWTKASLEALRFARRTDAEDYVSTYFGGDGPIRITEHMWCDAIERSQHGSKGDES